LYNEIQSVPQKVLAAIQGSINPQKGKMAELLTYAQIRYDYDVIIPLGQPIDFIGIKRGEKIDFIEVKSGPKPTLSSSEAEIERLVKTGAVNFRLLVVKDEQMHQDRTEE
jgi:predicted Holliday junction resolvase-like endonuclease